MDSTSVYKMIAMLCIEGFKIWDVLEVVGIDFAILYSVIWSYIVCEFLDFKCDSLSCEVINHKREKSCVWFWGSTNNDFCCRRLSFGGCLSEYRYDCKKGYKCDCENLFHNFL